MSPFVWISFRPVGKVTQVCGYKEEQKHTGNFDVPTVRLDIGMSVGKQYVTCGAILTAGLAIPVGGFLAMVYRFPIPFAGYASGIQAVGYAMGAVIFYGVIGGFPLLALLGALSGAVVTRIKPAPLQHPWMDLLLPSLAIDFVLLFVLSVLDKIIGPW